MIQHGRGEVRLRQQAAGLRKLVAQLLESGNQARGANTADHVLVALADFRADAGLGKSDADGSHQLVGQTLALAVAETELLGEDGGSQAGQGNGSAQRIHVGDVQVLGGFAQSTDDG